MQLSLLAFASWEFQWISVQLWKVRESFHSERAFDISSLEVGQEVANISQICMSTTPKTIH